MNTAAKNNPICFQLKSTSSCPQFSTSYVLSLSTITNVHQFDTQFNTTFLGQLTTFRTQYGCPKWDGTGLRHAIATYCAFVTDSSYARGCPVSTQVTTSPLCPSLVSDYITSLNSIWSNATACPGTNANRVVDSNILTLASRLKTHQGTCISNVNYESTCGFRTLTEQTKFCAHSSSSCCPGGGGGGGGNSTSVMNPESAGSESEVSAESMDTTSSSFGSAIPVNITTPTTVSLSGNTGSSSSSGPNIPMYIGIGAGAIVLFGLLLAGIMYYRSKKNKGGAEGGIVKKQRLVALTDFTAELDDELSFVYGDGILVEKEFDDGWARGVNLQTGKTGMFPMTCVGVAGSTSKVGRSSTSTRHSSRFY